MEWFIGFPCSASCRRPPPVPLVHDPLEVRLVHADAADHDARLALASLYAGQGHYRDAMEQLLEIIRRERDWRDGEARRQLLALFNVAASDASLVAEFRRKLASALH